MLDLGGAGPPLSSYRRDRVTSVTIVERDPERARHRLERAARHGLDVTVLRSLDDRRADERFDTVVSILALAERADLPAALGRIDRVFEPTGVLHLVEPVLAPGAWRALATPLAALVPGAGGWHLNRDVPSAVRAQGLTIVAIERFTMPTAIWPLRPFVQAQARRALRPPAAAPDEASDGR